MAEEGRSAPGQYVSPWVDQAACYLHPDQSFYGKPIDPEVVARVRECLDKYEGPNPEQRARIIANKVAESQKIDRGISAEYWAWTHNVKENTIPVFRLPDDPRKGMPTQEEYIQANVERGRREMRKRTAEYKASLENLVARKEAEKLENLEEKNAQDAAFDSSAQARHEEIHQRKKKVQQEKKEKEAEYWSWFKGMKERVAQRPCSAPAGRDSGVESASSMAQRKAFDTMRINREIGSEYSLWVRSVSVPKFSLPLSHVDHEDRKRRSDVFKDKVKQSRKDQVDWYGEVDGYKRKHHKRIMGLVRERLDADRKYDEAHEEAAHSLAAKLEEERKRQRKIQLKSQKELKDMLQKVKDKPLFLEKVYPK